MLWLKSIFLFPLNESHDFFASLCSRHKHLLNVIPKQYPINLFLCLFISSLLSTLPLLLHHFLFLIFWLFFFPILFCLNSISFLPFNPYFSNQKKKSEYCLSLSLFSFGRFFLFLITLIKGDGFFIKKKYVFWYCVF